MNGLEQELAWSVNSTVPRWVGLLAAFYPDINSPAQSHKEKNTKRQGQYCYRLGKSQLSTKYKNLKNKINEPVVSRLIIEDLETFRIHRASSLTGRQPQTKWSFKKQIEKKNI